MKSCLYWPVLLCGIVSCEGVRSQEHASAGDTTQTPREAKGITTTDAQAGTEGPAEGSDGAEPKLVEMDPEGAISAMGDCESAFQLGALPPP